MAPMIWKKRVLTPFGYNIGGTNQESKEHKRHGERYRTVPVTRLPIQKQKQNPLRTWESIKNRRYNASMQKCVPLWKQYKKQKTLNLCGCAPRSFNKHIQHNGDKPGHKMLVKEITTMITDGKTTQWKWECPSKWYVNFYKFSIKIPAMFVFRHFWEFIERD